MLDKDTPDSVKTMAPSLSLYLLGPLAMETYARTLALRYNKARALLAYLALESGFHTRESLAYLLWPEATMQSGREKLKRMLFELKEVLGPDLLEGTRDVIRLRAEAGLWTDLTSFNAAIDVAQRTASAGAPIDVDSLSHAVSMYRGEFLQGLELDDAPDFGNWVQARREHCRLRYLQAIRLLVEGHEKEGNLHLAIERARQWTAMSQLDDAGWSYLLRLLVRADQHEVARQELERYRSILDQELGTEPDPALAASIEMASAHRPVVPDVVATQAERRQLTVVSCEFVVLGEPEEVVEAMRGPVARCEALLRQASGYTVRTPSGGLLAYFGYPTAQEGSLKRAVSAALACSRQIAPRDDLMNDDREVDSRAYVDVCLGVHTGIVISSSRDDVPDLGGTVSRLAAQLGNQSISGEVIISEESRHLLAGAFAMESAGRMFDRARNRHINLYWVLDSEPNSMPVPNRLDFTFCGREAEMGLLKQAWHRSVGHPFLVMGEAGIGKSFMVERFCAMHDVAGVTFKCSPELRQMPFHPLVQWVEGLRAEAAMRGTPATPQESERRLALEAVVGLLHGGCADAGPWTVANAKEMLPRRLCRLIGLHVMRGGMVHFDDAHWADPSTRELMAIMAETPLAQRLMVVTARPEFVPPWRNYTQVDLLEMKPLDDHAIGDLITSVAGDAPLALPLMRQIAGLSEGVPLYAEELTRECVRQIEEGGAADDGLALTVHAVPRSLHDLLMSRIDSVGRAKPIAQFAAAVGSEFTVDLLAAAMNESRSELIEAIAILLRQNLIVQLDDKRYRFRHGLLREAAYQSQAKPARVTAHRKLAELLSRDGDASLSAPESLAWHYTRAGEIELALHHSLLAARKAAAKSAFREAVSYYRNALELLEAGQESGRRGMAELEVRMELGIQLGALYGYGAPDVVDAFRKALALAKPMGDDPKLFRIYWGLWHSASSWADFAMTAELAETLLRLAAISTDPNVMANAHYARGYSYFFAGQFEKSLQEYRKGIAVYELSRDHLALGEDAYAMCVASEAISLWYLGRVGEAVERADVALAHARRIDHGLTLAATLAIRAELFRLCGDADAVEQICDQAQALFDEVQSPLWNELIVCERAWAQARRGDPSVLPDLGLCVQRVGGIVRGLVPFFLTHWLEACDMVGDVQTALQVAARGLAAASSSKDMHFMSEFQRYKGKLLYAQGQVPAVYLPWLEQAVETARRSDAAPFILNAICSLARYGEKPLSADLIKLLTRTLAGMQGAEEQAYVRRARALLGNLPVSLQRN